MNRTLLVSLIVVVLGIVGCMSMKYNYMPQPKALDWPAQNKQTTVYVGDKMLIQGFAVQQKFLQVKGLVSGTCYDIPPGLFPMTGEDDKRYFFSAIGSGGAVNRGAICDAYKGITVPKNEPGKVCVLTAPGSNVCYDALYEIVERESDHISSYQRSLLYSGSEGKQAKFTYIETNKGVVTFSNNVTYDLNKSNTINYKGARIQVHSATNENITYTVLENFADRR